MDFPVRNFHFSTLSKRRLVLWLCRVALGFLTDLDGPGQSGTDPDRPRWTWCSHGIQTVLPDFGTNDCGDIGDLESEDIQTFIKHIDQKIGDLSYTEPFCIFSLISMVYDEIH